MAFRTLTAGRAVLAALVLSAASLALTPAAAHADGLDTTTVFTTASPVQAVFGDPWVLAVQVTTNQYPRTLMPASGTVDVYVEGIPGAYASGVPLSPGGIAYVAQPDTQPLLGSGTFVFTAEFVPAGGTGMNGSRTTTPATVVIAPLGLTAKATITDDPAVSEAPVITASLDGDYISKRGGAPAGEWSFSLTDEKDDEAFSAVVAQRQGAKDPIRLSVDTKLSKGTTYTLVSTFTPTDAVKAGLTVAQPKDSSVTTAEGTISDALAAPVPTPPWLLALLGAIFVALVVTIILFTRRIARRPGPATEPTEPEQAATGELSSGPSPAALESAAKD